jgi:hypothetical protein
MRTLLTILAVGSLAGECPYPVVRSLLPQEPVIRAVSLLHAVLVSFSCLVVLNCVLGFPEDIDGQLRWQGSTRG